MNDSYVMNKETGELVPCEQVIKEFYKDHGILESIFDYWNETKIEVENTNVNFPDFRKTIQ